MRFRETSTHSGLSVGHLEQLRSKRGSGGAGFVFRNEDMPDRREFVSRNPDMPETEYLEVLRKMLGEGMYMMLTDREQARLDELEAIPQGQRTPAQRGELERLRSKRDMGRTGFISRNEDMPEDP
jgi:hypothetical protein